MKSQDVVLNTNEKSTSVAYPAGIISIDGIKCRILLNTRAGSSYIASTIGSKLNNHETTEHQSLHQSNQESQAQVTRNSSSNIWRHINNIREYNTKSKQRNIIPRRYMICKPTIGYRIKQKNIIPKRYIICKATIGYKIKRYQNFRYILE